MTENQKIKEYLKKNLRLRREGDSIELLLEGEVLSRCDVETLNGKGEPSPIQERLTCDSCGKSVEADFFCVLCSEVDRPVCYQCCSCM